MKPRLLFATCLCLIAVTNGSPIHAQEKLEKILVGVAGLSGALAHAFIPKDAGLYEKYGLDIDLVFSRAERRRFRQPYPAGSSSPLPQGLKLSMRASADRT